TTVNQNVIVHDIVAPVPNVASLPDVTGQCSATIAAPPTATDNCSGTITGTTTDSLTRSTQGSSTVTWHFDDGHGNISMQTQKIVVTDTIAPVPNVASLPDVTGQCSATITAPPTATDNCSGTITGTTTDSLTRSTQGSSTVTWHFDDAVGNASSQTQKIVVTDTTPPQITTRPPTQNLEGCGTGVISPAFSTAAVSVPAATFTSAGGAAADNCGVTSYSYKDTASGSCPTVVTRTWTVTDVGGNTATCSQTITVDDTTPPLVAIAGPASGSVYPVGTTVSFTGTFSDSCGAQSCQWTFDTITQSVPVSGTSGSANTSYKFTTAGVYMVSLSVAAGCGSTATCSTVGSG